MDKLKAQAYDALVEIEKWQRKLKEINEAIANSKEPEKEPKEDK